MSYRLLASFITGSVLLSPAAAFAAEASDITEEEVMNAITMPADGRGGGMIAPYYGGGVVIDASITKEVTPDFVALNAYCDLGRQDSREEAKAEADRVFTAIKNAVGTDGRVRRMGNVSIYPFYDATGAMTSSYSANLSVFIRVANTSAAQRISDAVENEGCSANWDVRLTDPQDFEMSVLDDLSDRANKRKAVFEKLLGMKLTKVLGASLYTWADGYSTYDPMTNKVDATTTLNITFDLGGKASLPSSSTRSTPRG